MKDILVLQFLCLLIDSSPVVVYFKGNQICVLPLQTSSLFCQNYSEEKAKLLRDVMAKIDNKTETLE